LAGPRFYATTFQGKNKALYDNTYYREEQMVLSRRAEDGKVLAGVPNLFYIFLFVKNQHVEPE
jgi:hypothetical protein